MGSITVTNLGKAFKQYPTRWSRLLEWITPGQSKRHHLKWVLKDINFSVNPGEAVGIVGINGAGKSTLLKMITGTTQPTVGNIEIKGRVSALLELGMGFHPEFTGRQNAYMACQLAGLSHEEIDRLLPEIEKFADIGDYFNQPIRIYSSGMQVRVAFAVATAVRPDILIVDEALSVGDAYFQAKCYQRINQFKNDGTTLLLVSHSPGDLVKHCERAIFIKNGFVIMDGSARDVSNRYLDELFGKKTLSNALEEKPEEAASINTYNILMEFNQDLFDTRPGYRKEEYRWGSGGAKILDYLVLSEGQHYPSRLEGNLLADFYFKVRFDSDYESVVPGFLIKTLEGIILYGTNSFLSNVNAPLISVLAGETKIFRFSLPIALNEGYYLISFGISSGEPLDELVPLDRRYDSLIIQVVRSIQFLGVVDLAANFECISQAGDLS